jgi:hypothetical protein
MTRPAILGGRAVCIRVRQPDEAGAPETRRWVKRTGSSGLTRPTRRPGRPPGRSGRARDCSRRLTSWRRRPRGGTRASRESPFPPAERRRRGPGRVLPGGGKAAALPAEGEGGDTMPGEVRITFVAPAGEEPRRYTFTVPMTCTVGRSDDCAIVVPRGWLYADVSRRHCELRIDPPWIWVRDLESLNGTFVNGAKVGQRPRAAGPSRSATATSCGWARRPPAASRSRSSRRPCASGGTPDAGRGGCPLPRRPPRRPAPATPAGAP